MESGFWLFAICLLVLCLNLVLISHGQLADNQTNLVSDALKKRIDFNSIRFMDNQTAYMCIQVHENSTKKKCKNWTNDELRPIFVNIFSQDDELNQYFLDLLTKSLQDAFNKTN